jgi:hypothetical protein
MHIPHREAYMDDARWETRCLSEHSTRFAVAAEWDRPIA